MATNPAKSKYGKYIESQGHFLPPPPYSIYNVGIINWKQHKPNQKYPNFHKDTKNWQLLRHLTQMKPGHYFDLECAFAENPCPHWHQIVAFGESCRRKKLQFRIVKQLVRLPDGITLKWRLWRTE